MEKIKLIKGFYAEIEQEEYSCFDSIDDLLGDDIFSISTFHRDYNFDYNDYKGLNKLDSLDEIEEELKDCVYLKIRAYIHSGISISVLNEYPYNDRFDSGLFGIIYISKDKIKKEFNSKKLTKKLTDKIIQQMTSQIKFIDKWLNGEEYFITIYDSEGNEVDSYAGFIEDYRVFDENWIYDNIIGKDYILKQSEKKLQEYLKENPVYQIPINSMVLNNL